MRNQSSLTVIPGFGALGIALLKEDGRQQQGIFVADSMDQSPHLIFDIFLNSADPEPVEAEIEGIPFRSGIRFELVESLPFGALTIVGVMGWKKWSNGRHEDCDINGIRSESRATCFWQDELISFCDGRLGSPGRRAVPPRWWLSGLIGTSNRNDVCIVSCQALNQRGCLGKTEEGTYFIPDQDQWKY